jgi:serine/threonine-protein kinase
MNALTGTGALIGTPLYMAPERFLGQECTEKADAYSVGVILYRALSGELPFQGTVAQIMMQALSSEPPTLRRVAPEVPAELAAVIRAAMQDDPAARPTVDAIADVLDEVSPPVSVSAA